MLALRVETHGRLSCRVLVADDRGHKGSLVGDKVQFQVPGIVGYGVRRGDGVIAVGMQDGHRHMLSFPSSGSRLANELKAGPVDLGPG